MSNLSQSDLILAGRFVDGDLPAHEAARAKARISRDADFAAAVEQIRDQSSLLGRLPKFKPADDLADRTLQASMDQVKAIMGAWPIESESEKTTVTPSESAKPFDWKSTAALVASLAGVFMVGVMLWQNNFSGDSNMAMSESPAMPVASRGRVDDMAKKSSSPLTVEPDMADAMEDAAEPSFAASQMQKQSKSASKGDQTFPEAAPREITANAFQGNGVALSGTPMTPKAISPARQTMSNEIAKDSALVSQIWYVNQDSTASKGFVGDVLISNQIAVQREEMPQPDQAPDVVEAFYVAATPNQMKLAMSQISNNADIEMIEIPSVTNALIADAIQQQYTQQAVIPKANTSASLNTNAPPNFQRSQALGQQLVSNALPRGLPGPVPPILESGAEIERLEKATNAADLAMNSRSKAASAPGWSWNRRRSPNGRRGRLRSRHHRLDSEPASSSPTTNRQSAFATSRTRQVPRRFRAASAVSDPRPRRRTKRQMSGRRPAASREVDTLVVGSTLLLP